MEAMTQTRNTLSDPAYAAYAWGRYRRMMAWMLAASITTVLAVLGWLHHEIGALPLSMLIATIAGVGLSVLLGTALMGLVFLSSGTGHDEEVAEFNEEIQK